MHMENTRENLVMHCQFFFHLLSLCMIISSSTFIFFREQRYFSCPHNSQQNLQAKHFSSSCRYAEPNVCFLTWCLTTLFPGSFSLNFCIFVFCSALMATNVFILPTVQSHSASGHYSHQTLITIPVFQELFLVTGSIIFCPCFPMQKYKKRKDNPNFAFIFLLYFS